MKKYISVILFVLTFLISYSLFGSTITNEIHLTECGILSTSDTTYILDNDVRSDGTCFFINAKNISINLNGHSITYADMDFTGVINPGFEDGDSNDSSIPLGWDLSGAHGNAKRQDYTSNLFYDNHSLNIRNIAGDSVDEEFVLTSPVYLPKAGKYAFTVAERGGPYGAFTAKLAIDGISVVCTNQVSNMHLVADTDMLWGLICEFDITEPQTVRGKVILGTKDPSKNTSINIDEADIRPIDDNLGDLKIGMSGIRSYTWNKSAYEIYNGKIIEGKSRASYSSAINKSEAKKIHDLEIITNGINSQNINEVYLSNTEIYNNYLEANGKMPLNRQYPFAMINLEHTNGGNKIYNNILKNGPHVGIYHGNASGGKTNDYKSEIYSNTINTKVVASNGFAISAGSNLDIHDNFIEPIQGQGIGLGRESDNVKIYNNSIKPITLPCVEYSTYFYSNVAHGIRIKNYGVGILENVEIYGNNIVGKTNTQLPGCYNAVNGITNYLADDSGGLTSSNVKIHGNNISVFTDDYMVQHAIAYKGQGQGEFYNNTLKSNHILVELSDGDGGGTASNYKTFNNNTLIKDSNLSDGFYTVRFGYFSPLNNIWKNNNTQNGANLKDISFGHNNTGNNYSSTSSGILNIGNDYIFNIKDSSGNYLSGAKIQILNASGNILEEISNIDNGKIEKFLTGFVLEYKNSSNKYINNIAPFTLKTSKIGYETNEFLLDPESFSGFDVNIVLNINSTNNSSGTINIGNNNLFKTYYIRTDGGTLSQCNGLYDIAYNTGISNQNCALNHIFWLLKPNGLGGLSGSGILQGGDTVNIGQGSYMMGFGAPNTTSCSINWAYDCALPPIPSGPDKSNPTKIIGASGSSILTEFWGSGRANRILNLSGSNNVEISNLEITDHSACIFNSPDPVKRCNMSAPYTNPIGTIGIYAKNSTNVTLSNLNIHGLANTGIKAGRLTDWTIENVQIRGNGFVGWDGDIGHGVIGSGNDSSNSGTIYFKNSKILYSGCGENYPSTDIYGCFSQDQGGYGDGLGTYDTAGNWVFENSEISHNVSDGLDLLYHKGPDYGKIILKNSRFEGNAGQQLKVSTEADVSNSIIIGNCDYFYHNPIAEQGGNPAYYTQAAFNNCRAGGAAIATANWGVNGKNGNGVSKFSIENSTITGTSHIFITTSGDSCNGTEKFISRNNIFLGMESFIKKRGGENGIYTDLFYLNGIDGNGSGPCGSGSTKIKLDNKDSIVYSVKYSQCPNANNVLCVDPLFESIPPLSGANDIYTYGDSWNIKPKSTSPALDKSTTLPGTFLVENFSTIPLLDINGKSRSSLSLDWGAIEISSNSNTGTYLTGSTNIGGYTSNTLSGITLTGSVLTTSTGTIIKNTTSNGGGGGGGGGSSKDYCPQGDKSSSYYDGKCSNLNSNIGTTVIISNKITKVVDKLKKLEYTVIKNTKKNVSKNKQKNKNNTTSKSNSLVTSTTKLTTLQKYYNKYKLQYNNQNKIFNALNQLRIKIKILAKRKGFNKEKVDEVLKKFEDEIREIKN